MPRADCSVRVCLMLCLFQQLFSTVSNEIVDTFSVSRQPLDTGILANFLPLPRDYSTEEMSASFNGYDVGVVTLKPSMQQHEDNIKLASYNGYWKNNRKQLLHTQNCIVSVDERKICSVIPPMWHLKLPKSFGIVDLIIQQKFKDEMNKLNLFLSADSVLSTYPVTFMQLPATLAFRCEWVLNYERSNANNIY